MSLLHLLTHYSKENKALYDQQKAAQKGKPKQAASKPSKPAKTERHANQSAKARALRFRVWSKRAAHRALRSPDSRPLPCSR